MPKYSLKQIIASNKQKLRWETQFPVIRFFVRPLSFYWTYPIIRITQEPTHVVWAGFIIGLAGCFCFSRVSVLGIWPGFILLSTYIVLDSVDGNVARLAKRISYYGKFLDGVVGQIVEGSYCLWLGLGLYLGQPDKGLSLLLSGAIILACRLYCDMFQGSFYSLFLKLQQEQGKNTQNISDDFQASTHKNNLLYLVFANLNMTCVQLIVLALFAVVERIDLFILSMTAYYIVRFIVVLSFYILKAKKKLN